MALMRAWHLLILDSSWNLRSNEEVDCSIPGLCLSVTFFINCTRPCPQSLVWGLILSLTVISAGQEKRSILLVLSGSTGMIKEKKKWNQISNEHERPLMKIQILAQIIWGCFLGCFSQTYVHSAYHTVYFTNSSFNPYENLWENVLIFPFDWYWSPITRCLFIWGGVTKVRGAKSSLIWTNRMCVTSVY